MPQPKAPGIDWLLEAWRLAELLPQVPSRRLTIEGGTVPLDTDVIEHFDALLAKVNIQMNHAVGKAVRKAKQRQQVPQFEGTDVRVILATADAVLAKLSGTDSDLGVVDVGIAVHKVLAHARQRQHLSDDQRLKVSVLVAAMSGNSVALANQIRATAPRVRRVYLRDAKRAALEEKPRANWLRLLYTLKSGGTVKSWDNKTVFWTDKQGQSRRTALATFQRW